MFCLRLRKKNTMKKTSFRWNWKREKESNAQRSTRAKKTEVNLFSLALGGCWLDIFVYYGPIQCFVVFFFHLLLSSFRSNKKQVKNENDNDNQFFFFWFFAVLCSLVSAYVERWVIELFVSRFLFDLWNLRNDIKSAQFILENLEWFLF